LRFLTALPVSISFLALFSHCRSFFGFSSTCSLTTHAVHNFTWVPCQTSLHMCQALLWSNLVQKSRFGPFLGTQDVFSRFPTCASLTKHKMHNFVWDSHPRDSHVQSAPFTSISGPKWSFCPFCTRDGTFFHLF
jgi:hypothetical protein